MTPAVLMALSVAANPPLALLRLSEHVPVPGAVRLEARPFERALHLEMASPASAARLERTLRRDARTCPDVEADGAFLVFRCGTGMVRAELRGSRLAIHRLAVLPWRQEEQGPPLVAFDTEALGLGPCPGESPLARGECALLEGELAAARTHFAEAARSGSAHAWMRVGDLALAADDPDGAVAAWRRARSEAPWSRLVGMRLCELEPDCIGGPVEESVFDPRAIPAVLRADVILRRARLQAFRGDLIGAAAEVTREARVAGVCWGARRWCRHLLLRSLELPPPGGTEALALYLDTPGRTEGPDALPLARAAARLGEAAGAPAWAANLLASLTGRIPPEEQGAHLLRVAQLYLAGGDRVRADEIHRFAETRLSRPELAGAGWRALARDLRPRPKPASSSAERGDDDLAAARAAIDAARLAALRKGATP